VNHARWLWALLALQLCASAGAATRIDLNGDWAFTTEKGTEATAASFTGWQKAIPRRAETNAPAHIDVRWTKNADGSPAAFAFTLEPNGEQEMPYYPLNGYRVSWQLVDADNKAFADGGAIFNPPGPLTVERDVPAHPGKGAFRLVIKLLRPDGSLAMERALGSQ
jgi:hypothetical protein